MSRNWPNPALYKDFARWNDLHQEQDRWKKDLERLTAKWSSLTDELDEMKKRLTAV